MLLAIVDAVRTLRDDTILPHLRERTRSRMERVKELTQKVAINHGVDHKRLAALLMDALDPDGSERKSMNIPVSKAQAKPAP